MEKWTFDEFKESRKDPSFPPTKFIEHKKILYTKRPGPAASKRDPLLIFW